MALRVRPRVRVALGGALGAALFWVGLHFTLNRDAFAQAVRSRVIEQLSARGVSYRLGSRFDFSWSGECWLGPLSLDVDQARPTLEIEWIGVRPSLGHLLLGRLRSGHLDLVGLKVATDHRGERLAALWKRVRGPAGPAGSKNPRAAGGSLSLSVQDAWVFLEPSRESDPERAIGPFSLRGAGQRSDLGWKATGDVRFPHGGLARGSGSFSTREGLSAQLTARQVPLGPWAAALTRGITIDDGYFSGDLTVTGPPDLSNATARVSARVDRLVVRGDRISKEPLGPSSLAAAGILDLDVVGRRLDTTHLQALLGPKALSVPMSIRLDFRGEPTFDARVHLGPLPLLELIAALPPQVAPPDEAPHLDGPIAASLEARGPLDRPEDWRLRLELDTTALEERARAAPFLLRGGFVYRPGDIAGGRTISLDATNRSFIPLSQLPPILGQAVITAEDSAFYTHHGFDLEGLQNGLTAAIEGGRLRGGSTLTQQLVKNFYLSLERTYARKISEALITVQVEAALPKSRILELYLNAIEWGPNVYGAGEAARYYFGTDARTLTPKQAVFLASIIPNPTHWGPNFRSHGLSDVWQQRLRTLLDTLRERGFLTDEAYRNALDEELTFRSDGCGRCSKDGRPPRPRAEK